MGKAEAVQTAVRIVERLDRNEAWCLVGRRLLECDPEMFARILGSASRYVEAHEGLDTPFDDLRMAGILLLESKASM